MMTGAETNSGLAHGEVRQVVILAAVVMFVTETVIAVIFTTRLRLTYDVPLGAAAREGVFNAIQAFNNCGFSLRSTGLTTFVSDWWICVPLIIGGIGVPVLHEIGRQLRRSAAWSTHTWLTVGGSLVLLVVGLVAVLALKWGSDETLGPLGVPGKILAAFVHGTIPRWPPAPWCCWASRPGCPRTGRCSR